jgi:hypothetical protein
MWRGGDGQCFWMKKFQELYGVNCGYSLFPDDPVAKGRAVRFDAKQAVS